MKKRPNILDGSIAEHPDPETITANRAETAQREAEEAFDRSSGYQFQGELLQPFSIERQAAAQRLGLRYGKLKPGEVEQVPIIIPAEDVPEDVKGKKKRKKGEPVKTYYVNYPGMLDDCILVLFLCTLDADDIIMIRGSEREAQFWRGAYEWAKERGIAYLNNAHGAAYVLFRVMMTDIQKTEVAVTKDQKGEGPAGGEPGN